MQIAEVALGEFIPGVLQFSFSSISSILPLFNFSFIHQPTTYKRVSWECLSIGHSKKMSVASVDTVMTTVTYLIMYINIVVTGLCMLWPSG
jgi:hypothetical protein